jgi:hypothetical protein
MRMRTHPASLLLKRSKLVKLISIPICAGTDLVRLFFPIHELSRWVRFVIVSGIAPFSRLNENSRKRILLNAINELGELRHLNLAYNNFSGDIPPGFGMLPNLETLSL